MNLDGGSPHRLLTVPLFDAPPGDSELLVTVHDELSGRVLEAREPFRVEP